MIKSNVKGISSKSTPALFGTDKIGYICGSVDKALISTLHVPPKLRWVYLQDPLREHHEMNVLIWFVAMFYIGLADPTGNCCELHCQHPSNKQLTKCPRCRSYCTCYCRVFRNCHSESIRTHYRFPVWSLLHSVHLCFFASWLYIVAEHAAEFFPQSLQCASTFSGFSCTAFS